jgi:hypothetical protein
VLLAQRVIKENQAQQVQLEVVLLELLVVQVLLDQMAQLVFKEVQVQLV